MCAISSKLGKTQQCTFKSTQRQVLHLQYQIGYRHPQILPLLPVLSPLSWVLTDNSQHTPGIYNTLFPHGFASFCFAFLAAHIWAATLLSNYLPLRNAYYALKYAL